MRSPEPNRIRQNSEMWQTIIAEILKCRIINMLPDNLNVAQSKADLVFVILMLELYNLIRNKATKI